MPFVKLDCGILDSTIWWDKDARDVFLTALLMAAPWELSEPMPQVATRTLEKTGWEIPPGWYGFIRAAGTGIVRRSGLDQEPGLAALERLAAPELESRTQLFEGRRLVRVNGGYVVLNFIKYRDRDYTAPARSARYRARKASGPAKTSRRDKRKSHRDITQAEAEAYTDIPPNPPLQKRDDTGSPEGFTPEPDGSSPQGRAWLARMRGERPAGSPSHTEPAQPEEPIQPREPIEEPERDESPAEVAARLQAETGIKHDTFEQLAERSGAVLERIQTLLSPAEAAATPAEGEIAVPGPSSEQQGATSLVPEPALRVEDLTAEEHELFQAKAREQMVDFRARGLEAAEITSRLARWKTMFLTARARARKVAE